MIDSTVFRKPAGKYDMLAGRIHQADRNRAVARKEAEAAKKKLLEEMTALYCGVTTDDLQQLQTA